MKPMSGKIFLDTNILIYSYSYAEPEKQKIARHLISEGISYISTQVLQELTNTLTKKFKFNFTDAIKAIRESKNKGISKNPCFHYLNPCPFSRREG